MKRDLQQLQSSSDTVLSNVIRQNVMGAIQMFAHKPKKKLAGIKKGRIRRSVQLAPGRERAGIGIRNGARWEKNPLTMRWDCDALQKKEWDD